MASDMFSPKRLSTVMSAYAAAGLLGSGTALALSGRPVRGVAEGDLELGQPVRLHYEPVSKEVTLPFFVAG